MTFEIPEEIRGSGRIYSVIRIHDGETAILADPGSDENTVTIETDKFSTYVLAYTEIEESGSREDNEGFFSGSSGVNPPTGLAVSLIPLAVTVAAVTVSVKRKKK